MKFEEALRALGVNEVELAERLKQELDAKVSKWNQEHKVWDDFIDHSTRMEAIKECAEFLGAYPKKESPSGGQPIKVEIVWNGPRPSWA